MWIKYFNKKMKIKSNIILSNNKNFRKKDIHTNGYFEVVEKEHIF